MELELEIHHGCGCDGCNMIPIEGVRFKCRGCDNYDLCENCMAKNVHQGHKMDIIHKSQFGHQIMQVNCQFVFDIVPTVQGDITCRNK